jgi:Cu(I)/Ag(I) efflux system membrane fusion protein
MKKKNVIIALISLLVGLFIGWGFLSRPASSQADSTTVAGADSSKEQIWTCSMHPQIRKPQSGQCPICGMDLIPVSTGNAGSDEGPREISLSESAQKLAEIETAPVERRFADVEVRLSGKIRFDEKRLSYIVSRIPGRIDRLYASETGTRVNAGEHLADFYSPELISAQQELIQAVKLAGVTNGTGRVGVASTLADATREKLRLWGFTPTQVSEIERSQTIKDHLTFYAPIGGVVVQKEALEGMAVEAGMRLFTLADLSSLWVVLDAYESDLPWLRYGQDVDFEVESYPGEIFHGVVTFIDPVLDAMTRTVKVRVTTANPDGRLKPEMFVRAVVHVRVADGGVVSSSHLEDKWTCTMHPEVITDQPGPCPICEMPLVSALKAGFGDGKASSNPPILIPASAPLVTGSRAVVYVAEPDQPGRFEGREIELGPRAGKFYVVKTGLQEGERVVTRGNFKIDSSLQIQGKASMMSEGGAPVAGHQHGSAGAVPAGSTQERAVSSSMPDPAKAQMNEFIDRWVALADALAADDFDKAKQSASDAKAAMDRVDMAHLPESVHEAWMKVLPELGGELGRMAQAQDIEQLRIVFASANERIRPLIQTLGSANVGPLYVIRCPMAFDNKGAIWLHRTPDVLNPYYGAAMLKCGAPIETYEGKAASEEHPHE